jgi:hypothetical protein
MIPTAAFAIAVYVVPLPIIPAFAVALTLGILASYLVERRRVVAPKEVKKAASGALGTYKLGDFNRFWKRSAEQGTPR